MRTCTSLKSLLEAKAANTLDKILVAGVPPTFNCPLIPTPPVTTKAPEVGEVEAVVAVTANPDTERISVDGL